MSEADAAALAQARALQRPGWISIPGAFLYEAGVIRLNEPETADRQRLINQLLDGIYPRPFVLDDGQVRKLHFNLKLVQSEMKIDAPDALALAYTRKMMGFMLFNAAPRHIVIVGLGGGSLTKFCYRNLPLSRVTSVELNAGVIACRDWFEIPPDDERLRIVQADAADYFAPTAEPDRADVVMLDAYDEDGVAPQLCQAAFYDSIRERLKPAGVLVANISGHSVTAETHIALIREAFRDRVAMVDVSSEGNRILYAFRSPAHPPPWDSLNRDAGLLDDRHSLDFSGMLHDMGRNAQRMRRKTRAS